MLNSALSSLHSLCLLQHKDEGGAVALREARQRLADSDFRRSESPENEGSDRGRISSILYTVLGVCNDTTEIMNSLSM